mgnify:CR=1 FL=1
MSFHNRHLVDANVHIHDAPYGGADELQVADPAVLLLGGHEGDVEVAQVVVHSPTPAVTPSWKLTGLDNSFLQASDECRVT